MGDCSLSEPGSRCAWGNTVDGAVPVRQHAACVPTRTISPRGAPDRRGAPFSAASHLGPATSDRSASPRVQARIPSGGFQVRGPSVEWLLVLIPVVLVLDRAAAAAPLVFFVAALAIVPLAALIVRSTEQVAEHTGPAVGGLLNATFGNLPELIIALVALRAGLVGMVRASLIGAVLANVLLALGIAFLLGGRRYHVMDYNPAGARTYASMLVLAVITLAVPAGFHRFMGAEMLDSTRTIDTATSLVLLGTYVCYLVYSIRTHADFFTVDAEPEDHAHHEGSWSPARAVGTLIAASLGAAWMSEILVGAAEATGEALGMTPIFLGMVLLAVIG